MKDFLENPAMLMGIPLLALGLLGIAIAAMTVVAPAADTRPRSAVAGHGAHPGPEEYIRIGATLALITMIEVAVYYFDIQEQLFILILVTLSAIKFSLVVLFFMHLKFDSRVLSTAFISGFALAAAVFTVVITTLGANLV